MGKKHYRKCVPRSINKKRWCVNIPPGIIEKYQLKESMIEIEEEKNYIILRKIGDTTQPKEEIVEKKSAGSSDGLII